MSTADLREKLHEYINNADERVLRIMSALVERYENPDTEEPIAYTIQGEPLRRNEYIELNDQAEASYYKGQFTSHEQIRKKYSSSKDN